MYKVGPSDTGTESLYAKFLREKGRILLEFVISFYKKNHSCVNAKLHLMTIEFVVKSF